MSDIYSRIDKLLAEREHAWLAIDGMCASGKTTFAHKLAERYSAQLLHMDDFFLPEANKTEFRMKTPGGNVDHERFLAEIASAPRGAEFSYRAFDCKTQTLSEPIRVPAARLIIVEGAYSTHPALGKYYDLSAFMEIDPRTQFERVLKRNGENMAMRFQNEWIPLENAYFEAFDIKRGCDILLDQRLVQL